MKRLKTSRLIGFVIIFVCSVLASLSILSQPASAVTVPPDGGGNIIDNPVLLNATSMGTGQTGINAIQSFLTSKNSFLASYNPYLDCSVAILSNQQTIDAFKAVGAPCNTTISAAAMIYYASQVYGVNPQVVLATMQKEQSIITAPTFDQYKVNFAMGYGCPDSGGCSASPNSNFLWQIDNGTYTLRKHYESAQGNLSWWWPVSSYVCGTSHNYYKPNVNPGTTTTFYDDNNIAYATYTIANAATSSFYCYTPHAYNNPSGAYGNPQYGTVGLYYSGSYNFVRYFNAWFGSTYAFIYNGVNYSNVFDPVYYLANNPDVAASCNNSQVCAFNHFISYGLYEGRQSSSYFSVFSYAYRYPDLRAVFGNNLTDYVVHYINNGRAEGRVAVGTSALQNPVVKLNGVDYSAIYDFDYYKNNNPDLANLVGKLNDIGALRHFIAYGTKEGRQAKASFNVHTYRENYSDLRWAFGMDLPAYYMHYINKGQEEGRIATGTPSFIPVTSYASTDYSGVYDYQTYMSSYSDLQNIFGSKLDDTGALLHFIKNGMNEGRVAKTNFNVKYYRDRYPDLRAAFGDNLPAYYLHYIVYGQREGRVAI